MASAHVPETEPGPAPSRRGPALRAIVGAAALGGSSLAPSAGVGELLEPGAIAPRVAAAGKRQLLSVIAEMSARAYGVRAAGVFDALVERENLGSTGVGHGVALPHIKLATIPRLRAVFARLATPIEFEAVDDQPVDLVFAILAPRDAGSENLRALARVARLMRSAELRRQLRAAPSEAALRALLAGETRSSAA